MQYFMNALKNYANFQGRARRKEFWIFSIAAAVISIVATAIAILATGGFNAVRPEVFRTLFGLAPMAFGVAAASFVVFICPVISVTVRRLHDTGHSAAWISFLVAFWVAAFLASTVEIYLASFALGFIAFILFITNFILIFCADSQHGENQYGPNPKD